HLLARDMSIRNLSFRNSDVCYHDSKKCEHADPMVTTLHGGNTITRMIKRFTMADDLKESSKITQVKGTKFKDHYIMVLNPTRKPTTKALRPVCLALYKPLPCHGRGNSQVNDNKIDLLVQQYEQFTILEEESIDSSFARFNTIITSLKALDEGFSSKNYVRKFIRALHPKLLIPT
ncbi:hypothetical protein Tco_0804448, partial [Tanacetum coccineum]